MIEEAQRHFCGAPFSENGEADESCDKKVEKELVAAYKMVGDDAERVMRFEEYARLWFGVPYFDCLQKSGIAQKGLNKATEASGNQCIADYAEGKKKLRIVGRQGDLFGKKGFLAWAAAQSKTDIPALTFFADARLSPKIAKEISDMAGEDLASVREIIRLLNESLGKNPERKASPLQNRIVKTLVAQLKLLKRGMDDTKFGEYLISTAVEYVLSDGKRYAVSFAEREKPSNAKDQIWVEGSNPCASFWELETQEYDKLSKGAQMVYDARNMICGEQLNNSVHGPILRIPTGNSAYEESPGPKLPVPTRDQTDGGWGPTPDPSTRYPSVYEDNKDTGKKKISPSSQPLRNENDDTVQMSDSYR